MLEGRRDEFEEGILGDLGAVKQQRPPASQLIRNRRREEEVEMRSDGVWRSRTMYGVW